MRPEQLNALKKVCRSQEDLQTIWDNPTKIYKFGSKHQTWVTLCVAEDGPGKELVWSACVRLANPSKGNFKAEKLWTAHERIKARNILMDVVLGVGQVLGGEEFTSSKGLHFNKKLTPEEKWKCLRPEVLGN